MAKDKAAKAAVTLPDQKAPFTRNALAQWNNETKKAVRNLAREAELPFDRVRILPMTWERMEKSILPNGEAHTSVDILPFATSSIHKLKEPRVSDDNKVTYLPVPCVIPIPSKSTDGEHILKGFTSKDLIRSIFTDPNWCNSYYIWPMTDEDEARDEEIEGSEEFQEAIERRKQIQTDVAQQNMEDYTKRQLEAA